MANKTKNRGPSPFVQWIGRPKKVVDESAPGAEDGDFRSPLLDPEKLPKAPPSGRRVGI
jgi:hypothetical protein